MVDYPVFFPNLSTLTWDTFLTLRGPWGFYLNHVLPPRPSKSRGWVGGEVASDFNDSPSPGIWDLDWTSASGLSIGALEVTPTLFASFSSPD